MLIAAFYSDLMAKDEQNLKTHQWTDYFKV